MSDELRLTEEEIELLDKPINAIRALRTRTGLGLKEAKAVVEEAIVELSVQKAREIAEEGHPGRGWGRPLLDTCLCGAGLVWLGDHDEEGAGYGCPRCAIRDRDERYSDLREAVVVLLDLMSGKMTHTVTIEEQVDYVRGLVEEDPCSD